MTLLPTSPSRAHLFAIQGARFPGRVAGVFYTGPRLAKPANCGMGGVFPTLVRGFDFLARHAIEFCPRELRNTTQRI